MTEAEAMERALTVLTNLDKTLIRMRDDGVMNFDIVHQTHALLVAEAIRWAYDEGYDHAYKENYCDGGW